MLRYTSYYQLCSFISYLYYCYLLLAHNNKIIGTVSTSLSSFHISFMWKPIILEKKIWWWKWTHSPGFTSTVARSPSLSPLASVTFRRKVYVPSTRLERNRMGWWSELFSTSCISSKRPKGNKAEIQDPENSSRIQFLKSIAHKDTHTL